MTDNLKELEERAELHQRSFHAMNMDRSTLLRLPKKEGTTFKDLLSKIRKHLASGYLEQGMTATQTSYLLGFSEPSTFQRAFKRWFGKNPGEFRKRRID